MPLLAGFQVSWVTVAMVAIVLYTGAGIVYRLILSPLAKFPGPKLAAVTLWYEFYYDVIKQGQYTFKIRELHKQYGPIIRISPYELHVDDPEYYQELNSTTSPRDKYQFYVRQFGLPGATFSAVDHNHHRQRRTPMSPLFSKQSIFRLEPTINEMIEKLCFRLNQFKECGQPVDMKLAYSCLATDVVTLYAFNKCWNYLDHPEFSPEWCATIRATADMGSLTKQFPILFPLMEALPDIVVGAIFPGMLLLLNFRRSLTAYISEIMDATQNGTIKDVGILPRTVFHSILESNIPPAEKKLLRLTQEGQVVVGAGADTTASALAVTTFHLLNNPDKVAKLLKELEEALPDKFQLAKLSQIEQLPYLSAVINEGLRLSYGVSTRTARISPTEVMKYKDWTIPAGTPVGMTSVIMHHNERIFPDSYTFNPERWSEQPDGGRALERYLVSFGKGSRQCIGMNLAKAELYLTIATVFRRYDMTLHDTIRERDVDIKHDNFLPQASSESRGIRVIFK